jgi:hypothetical protein
MNMNPGIPRPICLAALFALLMTPLPAALAHGGDPFMNELFNTVYDEIAVAEPLDALGSVELLVNLAGEVHNETGDGHLLPQGTLVERTEWVNDMIEIDLTLPAQLGQWSISPLDQETLSTALMRPFTHVDTFAGMKINARIGADGDYAPLGSYVPTVPQEIFIERSTPIDDVISDELAQPRETDSIQTIGGPISSAVRQPTGALTGVTVFAAGGHGWTAGTSTWYLQRPLLLGMNEDYGNIDQLNLFCQYAFNAGATVVPMRPIGWQPIEIVIDQDDPEVNYFGAWSTSTGSPYYENGVTSSGVSYRFATANVVETSTARYTPNITVTDYYPVYCWALASTNRVNQTYRIAHSGGFSEVAVDHREVGNGWIWLGDYYFEAGGINYVEISNESSDTGVVIADAIRWGGGIGDVSRPGPGSISGYPRDEEAQRYWGESEWGNNAVGFSSSIYDLSGFNDGSDNVGTGARIAREMNQVPAGGVLVDRWKRIYLEYHTNASGGARGQICLISNPGATTNQSTFATMLSNEVDADMLLIDNLFEHNWVDRSSPTYTSEYGAIKTSNNGDEFDATIIEVAFHDEPSDAELLRDATVRAAAARSSVQGIIRFLNQLPNSGVPLAFPPDTPRNVRALDLGGGDVEISWLSPIADGARGDAATGYVVYQSNNGRGFGNPIVLGNTLSTTISGVQVGETRYFRVSATNNGGESMPSEVLAVRRPNQGVGEVLIVNGFDRVDRLIGGVTNITGTDTQRMQPRRINNFDYVVEHAEALAANDIGFSTSCNEAVRDGYLTLSDYSVLVWILGNEANELGILDDRSFDGSEQSRVNTYLNGGGSIFVTGAEIAHDLITRNSGPTFATDTLQIGIGSDDAGTYTATGAASSILSDIPSFSFAPSTAPYPVFDADRLVVQTDGLACLTYVGGGGGAAGVQYTGPIYNAVTFGFPFETIASPTVRADIMDRVITFLQSATGPLPFDQDNDGDVDYNDFQFFQFCYSSPGEVYPDGHFCLDFDSDEDADTDLADFWLMQQVFTGSL